MLLGRTRSGWWGRAGPPLVALVTLLLAPRASAFERQWHVGGGLGVAAAPGYFLGPAGDIYAAYGLSDAFDLRTELSTSIQGRLRRDSSTGTPEPDGTPAPDCRPAPDGSIPAECTTAFLSLKAVLAYKLDVIQWIPWIGPSVGGLASGKQKWPFDALQPTVGFMAGLDYAWTRHFGMGLGVSGDYGFDQAAVYGAGYLRAEYHWGW